MVKCTMHHVDFWFRIVVYRGVYGCIGVYRVYRGEIECSVQMILIKRDGIG